MLDCLLEEHPVLTKKEESFMFNTLFFLFGACNDARLMIKVSEVIRGHADKYSVGELERLLDIFKFSSHFQDQALRDMLVT